jgi:hypothetical protein
MSWEQTLDVSGGHLRLVAEPTGEKFTLSGLLQCTEPFLVRFQVLEYLPPFAVPETGQQLDVVRGTVTLRARKGTEPGDLSPGGFPHLCSRLLTPTERERSYGYVFSTDLNTGAGGPLRCSLNDKEHMDNEQILVEFAFLDEPYALIVDGVSHLLLTPEWLRGALRDKLTKDHGWPAQTT